MTDVDLTRMLPLYGQWVASSSSILKYTSDGGLDASHGLALLSHSLDDGLLECDIQLPAAHGSSGAFITFRGTGQTSYYAVGLGGWEGAYTLAEGRGLTLTRLFSAGNISNLVPNRSYYIRCSLEGQRVMLSVDGVNVIDYDRIRLVQGLVLVFLHFAVRARHFSVP